jgi:uncharacterized protein YndB with AHSA1/START domain
MPAPSSSPKRLSEESVTKGTGKSWAYWFDILDAYGRDKSHQDRAEFLATAHTLSGWWAQSVAIHYEWERGLRANRERSTGFGVSVRRTIDAPVQRIWDAWADPAIHSRWFTTDVEMDFIEGGSFINKDGDSGVFKRIVPLKRIRFTWASLYHEPGSEVTLEFTSKSDARATLELTHSKLASQKDADDLQEGWSWALDCLKLFLETGKTISFEAWKSTRIP